MAQRCGIIIQQVGGQLRIQLDPAPACAGCAGACGLLGAAVRRHRECHVIQLPAGTGEFKAGDRVQLQTDDRQLLLASFFTYVLPLGGLLAGAVIGQGLSANAGDSATAAGAGLGLLAGLSLLRWAGRHAIPRIRLASAILPPAPQ